MRLAGGPDALLGPADSGRHRGLRHQEGAGDLGSGQAADRPQRQGGLGGRGQRRMAAQEQQDERVVGVRYVLAPVTYCPSLPGDREQGRGNTSPAAVTGSGPPT
jgi:hypothetical protein